MAQRGRDGEDGTDALLDRLVVRASALTDNPLQGPLCPELETLGIDRFRQLSDPPYRLTYTYDAGRSEVTILLVADSRRDFRTLLEERLLRRS